MKANIETYRQKLLKRKQQLLKRVTAIDKDIRHEGMTADWEEQATERENDEVLESLGNAAADELVMIDQALQRLEAGNYFTCSVCGGPIAAERLELLPFTTRCINCAS